MVIEVRLFAALRRFMASDPSGIVSVDVADGLQVENILNVLGIDVAEVKTIMINADIAQLDSVLKDGDRLELFPSEGSQ